MPSLHPADNGIRPFGLRTFAVDQDVQGGYRQDTAQYQGDGIKLPPGSARRHDILSRPGDVGEFEQRPYERHGIDGQPQGTQFQGSQRGIPAPRQAAVEPNPMSLSSAEGSEPASPVRASARFCASSPAVLAP